MEEKVEEKTEEKKETVSFWKTGNGQAIVIGGGIVILSIAMIYFLFGGSSTTTTENIVLPTGGSAQEVRMTVKAGSYEPPSLTVKAGQPVRWMVDGTKAVGCTKYLVAPSLGINKKLDTGINVIEFTPTKKGNIGFSCSMGMVNGEFQVI